MTCVLDYQRLFTGWLTVTVGLTFPLTLVGLILILPFHNNSKHSYRPTWADTKYRQHSQEMDSVWENLTRTNFYIWPFIQIIKSADGFVNFINAL